MKEAIITIISQEQLTSIPSYVTSEVYRIEFEGKVQDFVDVLPEGEYHNGLKIVNIELLRAR